MIKTAIKNLRITKESDGWMFTIKSHVWSTTACGFGARSLHRWKFKKSALKRLSELEFLTVILDNEIICCEWDGAGFIEIDDSRLAT